MLSITGSDFYEIERIYDRSQEKYLDMSHLQVIIMGDRLLEGEGWKIFMEYLKEEPFVGENVYIFRTEDPEAVLSRESGGTSAGEYPVSYTHLGDLKASLMEGKKLCFVLCLISGAFRENTDGNS